MDYQHVTADTSSLQIFKGLGTNRDILVNADPEGRIVLLREPSDEEVKEAIEEYHMRRITYWWDNVVTVLRTDGKPLGHPPRKPPYVTGFLTNSFVMRGKKQTFFQFLKKTALRQNLPEHITTDVVDYCLSLPLEEQLTLLKALRPVNINELFKTVPTNTVGRAIEIDFLKCHSLNGSLISLVEILVRLLKDINGEWTKDLRLVSSRELLHSRVIELLAYLNQKKWLLLNKKSLLLLHYASVGNSTLRLSRTLGELTYWNDESFMLARTVIEEFNQAYKSANRSVSAYMRLCLLLRSTSIETIGDISPELLNYSESNMEILPLTRDVRAVIMQLTNAIIRSYKKDERYSHIDFPVIKLTYIGRKQVRKPIESLRTRGVRWVIESRPEFIKWVELFEEYENNVRLQQAEHLFTTLNRWLKYLLELDNPPLIPEDVDRVKHIRNVWSPAVTTYWNYLNTANISANSKNNALRGLLRFFDYYNDKLISDYGGPSSQAPWFPNPIRAGDGWNYKNQRKTHRYALGCELLDLLQEIILDRDQQGIPTFNWAKTHPSLRQDWIYDVDPATGETKKIWWPGRTIAIYMLLTVPLRSFQVRWLDEGIADEYVYDFDKQCLVPNPHPSAESGRQEGVFRLVQDPFRGTSFLGLWVNTNKTRQYDPTVIRGYEIPWPGDELFSMLRIMTEWNSKYFPNPRPVTLSDDDKAVTTKAVRHLLPKFYPLFRDRCSYTRRNPNLPLHYEKLRMMWGLLLAEAEKRLKDQGKQVELVEWIQVTSGDKYHYSYPRAKYDLHTLRVSGITSLIEKGVPIHIVSEYIAGHSTIIMTLYYEKTSPFKIRELLLQAQNNAEADLDGCLALLDQIDDPESILVPNNLDSKDDSAFQALKTNKGLWQIDLAGICPGTICEEGGPLDVTGKATSVPTGACGLCRFYITGPAFLFGQMQKLNNLMYSMREKGEELRDFGRQEIDLEDGGNRRSLKETRGRRERIDRELKDITNEWCNRYRLFQTSLAMLGQYQKEKEKHIKGSTSLLPLVTANTRDGLQPIVAEATNSGLVRQISLMHEVLGNFDLHKGPLVEYQEILDTILVNNNIEAFLLTIPKAKRIAAANLLGEFLINSMGDEAIDKLYEGSEALPSALREPTRKLLKYINSDKFVIAPPDSDSKSPTPQRFVQIKGLQA